MPPVVLLLDRISHNRAKKGNPMFTVLILALLWGGWRLADAAVHSLRDLPRNNEDMVFF